MLCVIYGTILFFVLSICVACQGVFSSERGTERVQSVENPTAEDILGVHPIPKFLI